MNGCNARVRNVDTGATMKHSRAEKLYRDFVCEWVEYGVSIRTLTLTEQIAARNEKARLRQAMTEKQAKLLEPLDYAEVQGLRFDPPVGSKGAYLRGRLLAWEAQVFVAQKVEEAKKKAKANGVIAA